MRRSQRTNDLLAGAAALAAIALGAGTVHAQGVTRAPDAEPSDRTTREQARLHFTRGVEFIEAEQWGDALVELDAARALRVTASVLFNLGLAHRALGHDRAAIQAFEAYALALAPDADRELRARGQQYLVELHHALGRLDLRVEPASVLVQIDGVATPVEHGSVTVDHGRRVVELSAEGFATVVRTLDVAPGATAVVEVRLVARASSATLRVESSAPDALIRIDDHDAGYGLVDTSVAAGHHRVEVRAPGHVVFRREFDAMSGQRHEVHATLVALPTHASASGWLWGGAAVLVAGGLVAGGILIFSATEAPYRGSLGVVTDALRAGGP